TLVYSPIKALWVALFLLILQQLDGNLIGPKVMGDQVGLNPLWIISADLIGGSLFGIIGEFLSVPIAAILKHYIDKHIKYKIQVKIHRLLLKFKIRNPLRLYRQQYITRYRLGHFRCPKWHLLHFESYRYYLYL